MKPIDERVADAISELEELLSGGQSPDEAICTAAKGEALKPEVLRIRAEKVLGDLRLVKQKNDEQADRIRKAAAAKKALYEFAEMESVYIDFPNWFFERVGRNPSSDEVDEMKRLSWEALLRKIVIEI